LYTRRAVLGQCTQKCVEKKRRFSFLIEQIVSRFEAL